MMWVGRLTLGTVWVNSVKLKGWRRPVLVTFVVPSGLARSLMPHDVNTTYHSGNFPLQSSLELRQDRLLKAYVSLVLSISPLVRSVPEMQGLTLPIMQNP